MKNREEQKLTKQSKSGLGVGIGLLLCGLCILAFPVYANFDGWPMWLFRIVGFAVFLIGIMGTCMEIFGGGAKLGR